MFYGAIRGEIRMQRPRLRHTWLVLAGLALAAPAMPQKTPVPDLLKRALSAPASKQLYAYDFEDVSDNASPDETAHIVVRGRIDPSRKKGDRVTITSLEDNSKKPREAKKVKENYEKNADGDIFCDSVSKEDVTNVADKGAAPNGGRLFTFTPKAESTADGEMKEIMKKMTAEAVVDETIGLLKSFTGSLTKKHTIMMIAEVQSANLDVACEPLPNGRAYSARTTLNAKISAFGQAITTSTVQTISNVTPVG
jgi:hypothetical protein